MFPSNTTIPARGFLVFDQDALNFALSSEGERIYFRDGASGRVIDAVRFGPQETGVATGRFPDGNDQFYRLQKKTPGSGNAPVQTSGVVINEVMYHPISGAEDDQYVELYNPGETAVNVSGWRLEDGIGFTLPQGTLLAPNGYLVVGKSASRLRSNYPDLNPDQVLGDFTGRLSGGGERIALSMPDLIISTNRAGATTTNVIHIVVDEVTYRDGGRWGQWSDGGGSSLERIDPRADGRLPSNWTDSDESRKAPWVNMSVTGRWIMAT